MRLRSKVVEIEAVEYSGLIDGKIPQDIIDFVGTDILIQVEDKDGHHAFIGGPEGPHYLALLLDETLRIWNDLEQQWINCPVGHYVIKGLKGEFYPCESEVLWMKYEVIDD